MAYKSSISTCVWIYFYIGISINVASGGLLDGLLTNNNRGDLGGTLPNALNSALGLTDGFQNNQHTNEPVHQAIGTNNRGLLNQNKNLANQMAEANKLLDRLKEINRQREQEKLKEQGNNPSTEPARSKTTKINNVPEKETTTESAKVNNVKKMKPLVKKKFYFQAQPVFPENEISKTNETVYFIEL